VGSKEFISLLPPS